MIRRLSRALAVLVLSAFVVPSAQAQFGQNKISYEQFDWQVYQAPHFDVHYYPEIEPFLEEIVSYAESAYLKLSKDLDHELRFRVPLIVYKTHGEFQQTNIFLSELPSGVAAFAEPIQYRMVLPINQPPEKLYQLIAHELVHIFQYSMFYNGYLGRTLRSNPPTWLIEGMASYLADDEDNLDRMAIRDAVVNNVLPPIQSLGSVTYLTYRYGHAIFDFIEQEHGKEGMRNFLFEFKKVILTNNLRKAIKEAFGYDIDEFNRRFNRYLRRKYFPVLLEKKSPDEYGEEIGLKKKGKITFAPTLSPSGQLIAVLTAPNLELDLVVLSAEDGSKVKNLTRGWTNKYRELVAEGFAGKRDLSWSPIADEVAVFARRENKWPLLIYNAISGKQIRKITFDDIFECASPSFSPDGKRVAFEGNRNGVVDIFEVDLETEQVRSLTQDDFFDANPWYAQDGKTLLYNRRIGSHWKIFSVDLADASRKTQLTFGPYSDLQPSYSRDGQSIFFSSDRGDYGVFNIHSLGLATGEIRQYTDVVGGAFSPVEMAERDGERNIVFAAFFQGTFRLYHMPLRNPEARTAAADRIAEPVEVEPFEPDMRLTADEDKKKPYKLHWDIEAPSIGVGVTDDGTFLADVGIRFADLLGNHRFSIAAASVSDFASYAVSYANFKRRYNWGATLYDYRDFFIDPSGGNRLKREYKATGGNAFIEYPFSRYYRIQASAGVQDQAENFPVFDPATNTTRFVGVDDTLGLVGFNVIGDTTRYQSFGPFQGKRFRVGVLYGPQISGDFEQDLLQYNLDLRTYKKLTARSVLAWRLASTFSAGERQNTYGFGGMNQLRGYGYRDFFGSRLAWTNLEFRFPLIDEMRFPIFALQQIRGFVFADLGAAWFEDDLFFDPELSLPSNPGVIGNFRIDPLTGQPVGFRFWDSENNRLQDGRASYGVGFQFFFLGGLQFNWVWSHRVKNTELFVDPTTGGLIKRESDSSGTRMDFYIAFDF